MLPGGIIPLADFVKTFTQQDFAGIETQINHFLATNAGFYINLISSLTPDYVIVVFEGPADEVERLRKE